MSLASNNNDLKLSEIVEIALNHDQEDILRKRCFEIDNQGNFFHILVKQNCDLRILKRLIEKFFGADIATLINQSNKFGITPFHLAIIMRRDDIIDYFLDDKLIDLEKKCFIDEKELNILEFANQQNNLQALTAITKARIEMIRSENFILENRSLLDIIFFNKKLAFQVLKKFISHGNVEDLKAILDLEFYNPYKIKTSSLATMFSPRTSIHCYLDFFVKEDKELNAGHHKTLQYLLERDFDINEPLNTASENVMHYLARRFDKDVFRLIVSQPSFNVETLKKLDFNHRTPLDLALLKCNVKAFTAMIDLQEIDILKQYLPKLNHDLKNLRILYRSNKKYFPKKYRNPQNFVRLCNYFYIALDKIIIKKELEEFAKLPKDKTISLGIPSSSPLSPSQGDVKSRFSILC
ncbi:MAG: hypothetical protein ACKO47_05550 [Alphaproteobacteria bacterium]